MRLGIIGYGAVARLHAHVLREMPDLEIRVWGPDRSRTTAFAREHGVMPARRLRDLLDEVHGVVVASPSHLHERQATMAVRAGIAALVELPACRSASAGIRLARLASDRGVMLDSAHTARYLEPYVVAGDAVAEGRIGQVRRVTYRRVLNPPARTWVDDALRHHGQHAVDLLLTWFGAVSPLTCHVTPRAGPVQDVRAWLNLAGGSEALVEVRYGNASPSAILRLEGTAGWLETDGFTALRTSHGRELRWQGDAVYREAIRRQDEAFFAERSPERPMGTGWGEMIEVTRIIDQLATMATRDDG